MDYPIQQALRLVDAPTTDAGKGAKRSREYVECVLAAPTLFALRNSGVSVARRGVKVFLRCDEVKANIDRGKAVFIQTMEFAREKPGGGVASRTEWSQRIVSRYAPLVDAEAISGKLATALDAAYVYQREVIHLSSSAGYNSQKHASDWLDWNQLIYLSDPAIQILTCDVRLRNRCSSSAQSKRVVLLADFLEKRGLML